MMKRNAACSMWIGLPVMTVSALFLVAVDASEKSRHREAPRLVHDASTSLEDAVGIAEKECDGRAVSVQTYLRHSDDLLDRKKSIRDHADSQTTGAKQELVYQIACMDKDGRSMQITVVARTGKVIDTTALSRYDFHHGKARHAKKDTTGKRMRPDGSYTTKSINIIRGSDIVGRDVVNHQGDNIGHIENLVVDPQRGEIAYAVLSFGGFMGFDDKLFAIPFRSLQFVGTENVRLNITKDRLERAHGFNKDDWPDMADRNWATQTHYAHDAKPYWEDEYDYIERQRQRNGRQVSAGLDIIKFSELSGMAVKDAAGEDMGEINDLLIDTDRGYVLGTEYDHGGFLGMGETRFLVPWTSFDITKKQDAVVMQAQRSTLDRVAELTENMETDLESPTYVHQVYIAYDVTPYWKQGSES